MFKLFNKSKTTKIIAPTDCKILLLKEVPDQVFADKMIGDGIAFLPYDGVIKAPGNGQILQIFPTNHALALDVDGYEILLHLGIDTVELKGQGFKRLVEEGQDVKQGDGLIKMDLAYIKEQGKSVICPIIITNMDKVKKIEEHQVGHRTSEGVILEIWGS